MIDITLIHHQSAREKKKPDTLLVVTKFGSIKMLVFCVTLVG